MIDNKLHDEIKWEGKALIVDTCFLGYGENPYETMALRHGGNEVECVRSATLEQAQQAHAAMLGKYTAAPDEQDAPKAPPPLSGKYAKLRDDLLSAYKETEHLEQTEDGGTCNFDAPVLRLPRWNAEKIKQAAEEAGGSAWKWTWGSRVVGWVFSPRSSGQGNRRTRRAGAISEALKRMGYDTGMYYAMD